MKISIDTETQTITWDKGGQGCSLPLYSPAAFNILSELWVKVGWNEKYAYTFSWLGRPVIQLPEDLLRMQEVIFQLKPDVIIETGVAHGGSLIYYAGLCKILGKGRVIGIDLEIRPHNRKAMEEHLLAPYITLLEGDSLAPEIIAAIEALIREGETVLIILDSCHTRQHVLSELTAYASFVSPGSYIVATDGIMKDLYDAPRGQPHWKEDNPWAAVREFLQRQPEFKAERPAWVFNESQLSENITHWPGAWLKRSAKS